MQVAGRASLSSGIRRNLHAAAASARGPWPHSLACVPLGGRELLLSMGGNRAGAALHPRLRNLISEILQLSNELPAIPRHEGEFARSGRVMLNLKE
jgi:hypothetical protein